MKWEWPSRDALERQAEKCGGYVFEGPHGHATVVTPGGETIGKEMLRQQREEEARQGASLRVFPR